MNIVRALLGGLVATVLVVGCGSDSGSSGSSAFSKCASGSSSSSGTSSKCNSCMQSKCSSELNKCYGSNYNGGACGGLISCAEKAPDPCNSDCTPDAACKSCITDFSGCILQNCASECTGGTDQGTGGAGNTAGGDGGSSGAGASDVTCGDLDTCCGKISNADLKSACQMVSGSKNDAECNATYASFKTLCN